MIRFYGQSFFSDFFGIMFHVNVNVEDTFQEVVLVQLNRDDEILNDQILWTKFFRLSQL